MTTTELLIWCGIGILFMWVVLPVAAGTTARLVTMAVLRAKDEWLDQKDREFFKGVFDERQE